MAHIYADRVKDTFTTTGTGAVTVSASAPASFRTFSAVCSTNDTFYYCIEDVTNNAWETGLGTYSGANQITRTTVRASSNSNSAVNFAAGTKTIFITPIAYMFAAPSSLTQLPAAGAITGSGLTMATVRLLGRTTAGTGAIEEIIVSGATLSGGVLTIGGATFASVASTTVSGSQSSVVFTGLASEDLIFIVTALAGSASNTTLRVEFSINNGSSYLAVAFALAQYSGAVSGANAFGMIEGLKTGWPHGKFQGGYNGAVYPDALQGTPQTQFAIQASATPGGSPINAARVSFDSGTISNGSKIVLWGRG